MTGRVVSGEHVEMVGQPGLSFVDAGVLRVAYREYGDAGGVPVVLLHGFPYDASGYDEVAPRLAAHGCRVVVPWLRGYGDTRFLSPSTPRSGQQAALAHDLLTLLDALSIPRAAVAGYDCGGRAACIVSALWPQRVIGLVSGNGYNIQHIASAMEPVSPQAEQRYWYQYYLHNERGRAGLTRHRADFCRLLWQMWSPTWAFDEATYRHSAVAFDNPDFVEVVVHSYRHRYGLVAGDPAVEPIELQLAARPPIGVPTVVLDGADDGVSGGASAAASHQQFFSGPYRRQVVPGVGHNLPQEAPTVFADAVLEVLKMGGAGGA